MTYIIGISFSRGSGYGPINQVYHEELTIGIDSIKYEFKPAVISEFMVPSEWYYKTTSPTFQKLFRGAAAAVTEVLKREQESFVTDIGHTSLKVTYADGTMDTRCYYLSTVELKECFSIIAKMVPRCEHIPGVLRIWYYREKGAKNEALLQRFCRFWKKDGG